MFKFVILLSALAAVTLAKVRSCDRGVLGPDAYAVRITGCDNEGAVCRLPRGRDVVGHFDFIARTSAGQISSLRPEITTYAFSVRGVYELPADRQNGCDWIRGTYCPLDQGEFATYELRMPVTEEYPLTLLDIEVRLYDQSNVLQFCTHIEAETVIV